jgi:hypothetical protein
MSLKDTVERTVLFVFMASISKIFNGLIIMKAELIAPCGMNCGICLAYLRKDRKCPGCHGDDTNKSITRVSCIIRNCGNIKSSKSGFCYECTEYPCKRLKQLDNRYRTKYSMSMIENLESIKRIGLSTFVEKEEERWKCLKCGGIICVHRGYCYNCGERVNQ